MVQDISIYLEKCATICVTNDCPSVTPYYKHPTDDRCVNVCPLGYIGDVDTCATVQFCSSTCDTCAVKNNGAQCSTCSSTLSSLAYDTLTPPGSCSMTSTNNAQYFFTINKDTALVTSALKSVTLNSTVTESRSAKALS